MPQLDGRFFPTFVAKLQGEKVLQNSPNKRWRKMLMLHNELLRKTWSSYSLTTIYDHISTPSSFWEIYGWTFQALWTSKTSCSYQKLLPIETARLFTSDNPGSCFTLACVKARESIWWRRTTKLTVTEFTILVSLIVVTKMIILKFLRSVLLMMRDRYADDFFFHLAILAWHKTRQTLIVFH